MARHTIPQYFKTLGDSVTDSSYFTPGVTLRLTVADSFGYPGDKGWLNYASTGQDNPIGWRGLSIFSYPFFIISGIRSALMKGIDWLVLGRKMFHGKKQSPWWAVGLKGFVAALFYPAEVPAYFLAKLSDKIVAYLPSKSSKDAATAKYVVAPPSPRNVTKASKPSLIRRLINWMTPKKISTVKSTSAIEKSLSTVTHDVHNHGSKVSAASNHPIFHHANGDTHGLVKEYNEQAYEALKHKAAELKTDYHNTNQPDLNITAKLKEIASLIYPTSQETLPLRARRLEMIHKFQGGKSDIDSAYANHFKMDWEKLQKLIFELEKDVLKLKATHRASIDSEMTPKPNHDPKHH